MSELSITAVARLKHTDLWRAAKKLGSQAALARELGVDQVTLGRWVNLKSTPSKSWSDERKAKLDADLFRLTGKSMEELFPQELVEAEEFLKRTDQPIEQTVTVQAHALLAYAEHTTQRLIECSEPIQPGGGEDVKEAIERVIKTLTYREREIIKLRFGLLDGEPLSRGAIGRMFKVTPESIAYHERRALRKLQHHIRADQLRKFVSGLNDADDVPD